VKIRSWLEAIGPRRGEAVPQPPESAQLSEEPELEAQPSPLPQPEPVAEPETEPEPVPVPEPEPEPPPPPEPAHLAPVVEPPTEPEPKEARESEPEVVVPLLQPDRSPREWNIWELERIAAASECENSQADEERAVLLVTLRPFADAAGDLPIEFDMLVRDAFGDTLVHGLV
jgi:hypothetical protein